MSQKINDRENYTMNDLIAAKTAVYSGEMTGYQAAKHFSIPKATIYDNLKEKFASNKLGAVTQLSFEKERKVVDWIIACAEQGFPRTRADVIAAGSLLLRRKTCKNDAANLGEKWYLKFRRRHPEISDRAVSVVSRAIAVVSENNIRGWHQKITEYFTQNDLMHIIQHHPERVFKGDESGFQLVPDIEGKVLGNAVRRMCSR